VSIDAILAEVSAERARQDALADRSPEVWLAILGRAVGDVCAVVEDQGHADRYGDGAPPLRRALVRVAAVCAAWAEALSPEFGIGFTAALPSYAATVARRTGDWLPTLCIRFGDVAHGVSQYALLRCAAVAAAWAASPDRPADRP
jgi:hypothetical protein